MVEPHRIARRQRVLVARRRSLHAQGEVLHRGEEHPDAFDTRYAFTQPVDDLLNTRPAFLQRLEADHHLSAAQHRAVVGADIGAQPGDRRVGEDGGDDLPLDLFHRRERHIGQGDRPDVDDAGVLGRHERLRDGEIDGDGAADDTQRHDQRDRAVAQHPGEARRIKAAERRRLARGAACAGRGIRQEASAQHRRQGQRHHRRKNDDRGQRHAELAEIATDHIGHEQDRDQGGDQRRGDCNDREADLPGAIQRCRHRALPGLATAQDVLDHNDRVVDDKADADGQRHQ